MTRITEGAINVVSAPGGWYWHIPLAGDVWSVGFVTRKQHFAVRQTATSNPIQGCPKARRSAQRPTSAAMPA